MCPMSAFCSFTAESSPTRCFEPLALPRPRASRIRPSIARRTSSSSISRPRYASITAWSFLTSSGLPSAIFWPWSSTVTFCAGVHHHPQDVLDDDHGESVAVLQPEDDPEQVVHVDRRQPRRRLVEQQQARAHRHRAAEREQPALSDRELGGQHVGEIGETDEGEQLHHLLAHALLFGCAPRGCRASTRSCRSSRGCGARPAGSPAPSSRRRPAATGTSGPRPGPQSGAARTPWSRARRSRPGCPRRAGRCRRRG